MRVVLAHLLLTAMLTGPGLAQAPAELEPLGVPYAIEGRLEGKNGKAANDVSGIACLPPAGSGPRRCLVIDDEGRRAQSISLRDGVIKPGAEAKLIGKKPSSKTLGRAPSVTTCPKGRGSFSALDGEGVAFVGSFFYVAGSHGCARNAATFNLSSFILARVPVDAKGQPVGEAETTYRLADALKGAATVGLSFGKGLNAEDNGLDVEGLAIIGDRLFAGLRAPVTDGVAYLVAASVPDLFAPGHAPFTGQAEVIPLALGAQTGVRDLAPLPDGRLLVLAGPTQEQPVPYVLFAVEPTAGGAVRSLGRLPALSGAGAAGKAEGIAVLAPDRVLVMFDSLENGGARAYRLRLD